jgi:chaperonin GroEL
VLNGGIEGAIVIEKIKTQGDANFGFNAATSQYEDLVKAGVIDPTKGVHDMKVVGFARTFLGGFS